jgi:hypothetical protein
MVSSQPRLTVSIGDPILALGWLSSHVLKLMLTWSMVNSTCDPVLVLDQPPSWVLKLL